MAALALSSCSKEEKLEPSYKDKDWYVIEDKAGDELQHQRHLLYKDHGVSMFFTDTLGSVERNNYKGDKVTVYQIFRIGYMLNASSNGTYGFKFLPQPSETHTERLDMLNFIRSEVIEKLPKKYMMKKVLAVNSFTISANELWYVKKPVYPRIEGGVLLVGNMPGMLGEISTPQKQHMANKIKAACFAHFLMNSEDEQINTLLLDFFAVTNSINQDPQKIINFYHTSQSKEVWGRNGAPDSPAYYGLLYTKAEDLDPDGNAYGANSDMKLTWQDPKVNSRIFISKEADLTDYIILYFEKTKAEVDVTYAAYDPIKTKFGIIQQLMGKVL